MTKLIAKLKTSRTAYKIEIHGTLTLPYAERQLPRGESLRNGDLATASDGRVFEVRAQSEKLLHIDCPSAKEAATVGYLLGNGHVPAQIGKGFVRVVHEPRMEEMLHKVGLKLSQVEAPFEPDIGGPGAAGHHHDHHHDHDHDHHHHGRHHNHD
jgi:urease accessory protein